jgi:hypothetical protein
MKKGARILPVINADGKIIDGVILKKLMWFIVTNKLKKSDSIQEVWTRDIAVVPYKEDAGVLERTLERH